jgi:hypothetical protein
MKSLNLLVLGFIVVAGMAIPVSTVLAGSYSAEGHTIRFCYDQIP